MIQHLTTPARATLLLAALASAGPGAAETIEPSHLVQAFDETCRLGFPNLQTVRASAVANGWAESQLRVIAAPRGRDVAPPQALRKGRFSLLMAAGPRSGMPQSCHVFAIGIQGRTRGSETIALPELAPLAAALAASLGLGEPAVASSRDADQAQWRLAQGYILTASVQSRGPGRSASIAVRVEP